MHTIIFSFLSQESISIPFDKEYLKFEIDDVVIYKIGNDGEDVGQIQFIEHKNTLGEEEEEACILRKATKHDLQKLEQIKEQTKEAKEICITYAKTHGLEMNIVTANYSFDNSKVEFIFTAPNRVDFRELLKDLVKHFKKKIRLKQIGPRDKAKIIKGMGICGREFCCSSYMIKIPSVNMEASRIQNIAHKSTEKLTGACGKLLCCLNYEVDLYRELKKTFPSVGESVSVNKKSGIITNLDILNNRVKVKFDKSDEISVVSLEEVKILGRKTKKS